MHIRQSKCSFIIKNKILTINLKTSMQKKLALISACLLLSYNQGAFAQSKKKNEKDNNPTTAPSETKKSDVKKEPKPYCK